MSIRFAHPVADAVRQRVLEALQGVETRHGVRVLFACESGSRGWGFASPDSDYDVRFLYVHSPDWYLSVEPQRDVIEMPINDELDVSGWELRKALRLMHRSNPTLFEWLASPIVYREDPAVTGRLSALTPAFFSEAKGRWHYLHMARKNFREHLQKERIRLKKYLYVLRPLLAAQWIDAGRGIPPMRFADLAETMLADQPALQEEIDQLLAIKMSAAEAEYGPRFPLIHAWIETTLTQEAPPAGFRKPEGDQRELDRVLREVVRSSA